MILVLNLTYLGILVELNKFGYWLISRANALYQTAPKYDMDLGSNLKWQYTKQLLAFLHKYNFTYPISTNNKRQGQTDGYRWEERKGFQRY